MSEVISVLQSTINSLGYDEDGKYFPEPDCLESIRDVIRFIRDDQDYLARKLCMERNIVQYDLIPIMKSPDTSNELFDIALRLCLNLCQPTLMVFNGILPGTSESWNAYNEIEKSLRRTNLAFADVKLLQVLFNKAEIFFKQNWKDRSEESRMVIERAVTLICYALMIGENQGASENENNRMQVHEQLLIVISESNFADLIIDVTARKTEYRFHVLFMEVVALMIKQYDVQAIVGKSTKDEVELRRITELEDGKQSDIRWRISGRHGCFSGSYLVKGVKAVNKENNLIIQRILPNLNELDYLDKRKTQKIMPKNRRPFELNERIYCPSRNVRQFLKSFCEKFLKSSYNRIMTYCKSNVFGFRRGVGQHNTEIHYFLIMSFFVKFCHSSGFSPNFIKSTLNKETFHQLQTKVDEYLEWTHTDRKEGKKFGLCAQYAVGAYKELLCTLVSFLEVDDDSVKMEIRAICNHILQMEEYRTLTYSLLRHYRPGLLSKTFLQNLILANHIYLKLIEKSAKLNLLSKVIRRQKVRKKKSKNKKETVSSREVDLNELWDRISEELSNVIIGYVEQTLNISAIDVLLEVDNDVHQLFAMLMVQKALRERRITDSVGIYRNARSMWPTENLFGFDDISPESEFLELHSIFFSDLDEVEVQWKAYHEKLYGKVRESDFNFADDNSEISSASMDEKEITEYIEKEVDFDFKQYLTRNISVPVHDLASVADYDVASVLISKFRYTHLLENFESNSRELNGAILNFFCRIAFDLKQPALLYQLSTFHIFVRLDNHMKGSSKDMNRRSPLSRLYAFGNQIIAKFFAHYKQFGPKLMVELIFWKGQRECYDIEYGYGSYEKEAKYSKTDAISEEILDEIRKLYGDFLVVNDLSEENIDLIDYISSKVSIKQSRAQILRILNSLGLNTFGIKAKRRPRTKFSADAELRAALVRLNKEYALSETSLNADLAEFIQCNLSMACSRLQTLKHMELHGIRNYSLQENCNEQRDRTYNDDSRIGNRLNSPKSREESFEEKELFENSLFGVEDTPRRESDINVLAASNYFKSRTDEEKPSENIVVQGKRKMSIKSDSSDSSSTYRVMRSKRKVRLTVSDEDDS